MEAAFRLSMIEDGLQVVKFLLLCNTTRLTSILVLTDLVSTHLAGCDWCKRSTNRLHHKLPCELVQHFDTVQARHNFASVESKEAMRHVVNDVSLSNDSLFVLTPNEDAVPIGLQPELRSLVRCM